MRDPSGMLPCNYGSWDDIFYVASDVPLLCEASGQQPAIDWHELGRTLYVNGLPQRTTALAGIFQLLPGMTLKIVKGRAEETIIWSLGPASIVRLPTSIPFGRLSSIASQIGSAHGLTPVPHAHLVCRLLLEQQQTVAPDALDRGYIETMLQHTQQKA